MTVKPTKSQVTAHLHNRDAAERTIDALRSAGRLEAIDSARIAAFQTLADSVDLEPNNASLWREYRAAEMALRELNDGDDDTLGELIGALSAKVGDTEDAGTTDARPRGRRRR